MKNATKMKKTSCLVRPKVTKPRLTEIIEVDHFSALERLVRVTAWCRRFINNCRQKNEDMKEGELDTEEYEGAKGLWLKSVQQMMTRRWLREEK